jgi:hypothetical protein
MIQETERLVADPAPGITASPHDDNLRYFDVTIQGPDGSPFQRQSTWSFLLRCIQFDVHRGRVQSGTVLTRGVPNESTESKVSDQDLSS